jgi:NADH-quinone oxidoreductase subunit M
VWSAFREWDRPRLYYFHFGLAESAVLGAFVAQDLALFVAFFDLMLIPFYFLIGMWGSGERVKATTKLVIYTLIGSFFMLAAAIATGVLASNQNSTPITFALTSLGHLPLSHRSQEWIFLCFAVAFLVKMPLVPFHGWLADGYKAMPIPAVAVFSGVLSKVAAYGFLRIVLPLFPYATRHYQLLMLMIALVSIVWATSLAFTTDDARLVIAYSSVAQLGFIALGIFSLRDQGAQGALLQMLNHGLVTAPAFFIVAASAARTSGSEKLKDMGGIAMRAPVLATMFLIVSFANLAMPGSSNFIGEFLILLGTFQAKAGIAVLAFLGVVGASVYALRLFIRAMHNRQGPRVRSFELSIGEAAAIVPLIGVILALAFYPQFGLHRSQATIDRTVAAANGGSFSYRLASAFGSPAPQAAPAGTTGSGGATTTATSTATTATATAPAGGSATATAPPAGSATATAPTAGSATATATATGPGSATGTAPATATAAPSTVTASTATPTATTGGYTSTLTSTTSPHP